MLAPSQFQLAALGWHQQLTTLVRTQFRCRPAAALPHGGLEPKLLRFGSAANVWQLVRLEEEEIDDRLNVDLRLARFKQVMVKDWGNQTAANGFSFGP